MNAQKRFYEQLDIVNILKTIRRADFFMKAKLTQRQLFLLKIQRKNMVSSESQTSEHSCHEQSLKDLHDQ